MKHLPKFLFNRENLSRPTALNIPSSGIKEFVQKLSHVHNITSPNSKLDELGIAVTKMSGDTPTTDETRNLLIALTRANKISPKQMLTMLSTHLQENKRDKPKPS